MLLFFIPKYYGDFGIVINDKVSEEKRKKGENYRIMMRFDDQIKSVCHKGQ